MEPTLRSGDHVEADPVPKVGRRVPRGAIVVLQDPESPRRWLIKRVAGIGGDRLWVAPEAVRRVPRGGRLDARPRGPHRWIEGVRVPAGYLYLVGDHLAASRDSRRFGPVARSQIVGVVPEPLPPGGAVAPTGPTANGRLRRSSRRAIDRPRP